MGYLYYLQIGELVNPTITKTMKTVLTLTSRQLLVNVIGMIFHVHGQNLKVEDSGAEFVVPFSSHSSSLAVKSTPAQTSF